MSIHYTTPSTPPMPHTIEDTRHRDAARPAPVGRRRRSRRRHKHPIAMAMCVLVALTCVVMLAADYLVPNGITNYVVAAFAQQPACVYAVSMGAYDTLEAARAAAAVARERGAAGFVAYDGHYNVLLAAYNTQQEARSVADKGGYTLFTLYTDSLEEKDFPLSLRSSVKPLVGYPLDLFGQLCEWSTQLAQKGTTVAYAQQRMQSIRDALAQKAQDFLASSAQSGDATTLNYRSVLSGVLAALDNLCAHTGGEASFLADLRWTAIMVLRANRR